MHFKKKYIDFVVEENLPIKPRKEQKPDTPWILIKIEKKNRNTMDVVDQLCKQFNLPRKKIGIAGLKDKHALARQWICFHSKDVARIGERQFMDELNHLVKIVDYGYTREPLNLSSHITNTFWIRLRNSQEDNAKQHKKQKLSKAVIEERLETLYKLGFWNLYGEQRFGYTHANHRIAQDIIEGRRKNIKTNEAKFKLQALASRLFNEYCHFRGQQWGRKTLDGDIIYHGELYKNSGETLKTSSTHSKGENKKNGQGHPIPHKKTIHSSSTVGVPQDHEKIPTGPVFGDDLQQPDKHSQAGKLEEERSTHFDINKKMLQAFKKSGLYGRRRALRVTPRDSSYRWQGEDLLLQFTLPSGSYASVLIDELLQ